MAAPAGLPLILTSSKTLGPAVNTYTTAKRVINDIDAVNMPGNFLSLGARFNVKVMGGLSNIAASPGNVFFQIMMGTSNIIAWTSGNLAFNASARTLLPFSLDLELRVAAVGTGVSAAFIGQAKFGGIHLTGTDGMIQVPTTPPANGTGFDSVAAAGNVFDLFGGFSVSNAGNGLQITTYEVTQLSGFSQ